MITPELASAAATFINDLKKIDHFSDADIVFALVTAASATYPTVSTVVELDALPVGTVAMCIFDSLPVRKESRAPFADDNWEGISFSPLTSSVIAKRGGVRILHIPETV